jgi:NADPH:quinone reductase-like Zn-dependent oxidoreductase
VRGPALQIKLAERQIPWPRAGEVLVRVRAFGACGQDLQQRRLPPYNFTFRRFSSSRPLSRYTRCPLLSICFTCS